MTYNRTRSEFSTSRSFSRNSLSVAIGSEARWQPLVEYQSFQAVALSTR